MRRPALFPGYRRAERGGGRRSEQLLGINGNQKRSILKKEINKGLDSRIEKNNNPSDDSSNIVQREENNIYFEKRVTREIVLG